jgi:hypothetical protein
MLHGNRLAQSTIMLPGQHISVLMSGIGESGVEIDRQPTTTQETPWERLTPDERLDRRCKAWLSPLGVKFASPQAEAGYKARVTRLLDAILLKKNPDRVPVTPHLGEFAAAYCGYTQRDVWYDVDKAVDVANRCTLELDFDAKTDASGPQGRVYEILEEKQRKWPGHGLPDNVSMQFVEGEYMKADEYDAFILDESDFRLRTYLPRVWGAAEALRQLATGNIASFGIPEVQAALTRLMRAGEEARRWQPEIAAANRRLNELGYPDLRGSPVLGGGAPFDRLGDNLRGQRGIGLDMYRQPEKLLEAIDVITRKRLLEIRQSSGYGKVGGSPIIGFPLHKGADGFMSDKQFRTFYWPSLRRICLALIEEGFIPELRTQGSYTTRLEAVRGDLPRGRVIWHLYLTDMKLAHQALGKDYCLVGAVPQSILSTGRPEDVETYCKHLIDLCGKDGGFMVSSPGALGTDAKPDNVRAMVTATKQYGVY